MKVPLRRWRFKLYSGSTLKSTYIISQSHWEQRTPPKNQQRCCVSYKESKQAMHATVGIPTNKLLTNLDPLVTDMVSTYPRWHYLDLVGVKIFVPQGQGSISPFEKSLNTLRKHKIFLKGKYFLHLSPPHALKGGKSNNLIPSQVMPFFSHLTHWYPNYGYTVSPRDILS